MFVRICLKTEDNWCPDSDINDMIKRYIEIMTLFDYLFSIARTPNGQLTEELTTTAKKLVDVLRVKWLDLRLSNKCQKYMHCSLI